MRFSHEMKPGNFFYRQQQRAKYWLPSSDFAKAVAEINFRQREIIIRGKKFEVACNGLMLDIERHGFIIKRFPLFKKLALLTGACFQLIGSYLSYTINGIHLLVKTHEELFIIDEIFVQNCYRIVVPEERYGVIDIGMNVGYASLFFASDPSVEKVLGYEPFKPTFDDALSNLAVNEALAEKIVPANIGLGRTNGVYSTSYTNDLKGKNSLVNTVPGYRVEEVHVANAYEVLTGVTAANPELAFYIKMDCEGSEFEIFDTFGGHPLPEQVRGILMEWHGRYPHEILLYLRQNGFRIQVRGAHGIGTLTAFRT